MTPCAETNPVLPLELFNRIFEYLSPENDSIDIYRPMIRVWSLVCKHFNDIGRSVLFADLEVAIVNTPESLEMLKPGARAKLAAIHAANPELMKHVRNLIYYFYKTESLDTVRPLLDIPHLKSLIIQRFTPGAMERSLGFTLQDRSITGSAAGLLLDHHLAYGNLTTFNAYDIQNLPIFDILRSKNLQELRINVCNLSFDNCKMSPESRCNRPYQLRTLKALYVPELPMLHILQSCPHLKSVDIRDGAGMVLHQSEPAELGDALFSCSALEDMHDGNEHPSYSWAAMAAIAASKGTNAFPALKRLALKIQEAGDLADASVICAHAPCLQELDITLNQQVSGLYVPALHQCISPCGNTIKVLKISWDASLLQRCDETVLFLQSLGDALKAMRQDNVLEELVLEISVEEGTGFNSQHEGFEQCDAEWDAIDRALFDDPESFVRLKQLNIRLCASNDMWYTNGADAKWMRGDVVSERYWRTRMPRMLNSGTVKLTFAVESCIVLPDWSEEDIKGFEA